MKLIYEMDAPRLKHTFYNKRSRRGLPSPDKKIRSRGNCASLSCDVDAKISCGGKTFETKFNDSNKETEKRRKH